MLIAALITAAGSSSRMGGTKKEFLPLDLNSANTADLGGLTVLGSAVKAFTDCKRIGLVVITVSLEGEFETRASLPPALLESGAEPRILFVPGGPTRRSSVHHGLSLLGAYNPDYVLIHDGARPWIHADLIEGIIDGVIQYKAVIPLLPFTDTPKELDEGGRIIRHLKRGLSGGAQTPQAFSFPEILAAHEQAAERECLEKKEYTDDAEVWGEFAGEVMTIPGDPENKKVTYPEDLGNGGPSCTG
jgi:2-C-methyl-D-erythritol 4-phosphate cytidylyltransferase/2-C-methyl-D-erythritol 4-phosphate cytidylyltransferase/2-C-methyl-D-erythritol 2,4-cyclodiphosphate synthase